MDYEAVAQRVSILQPRKLKQLLIPYKLGCTGKAITQHLAKLRKEIRSRDDPIPLIKPQNMTEPINWTNRPRFTEAVGAVGKPDDSNARFGLSNANRSKDALFIKNEIAKLEASLGEDGELVPWSKEEENALELGLRRFSGPYWSDILGLFGPNGSVSNVLKDRDEAQMSSRACRMKISFLKSGVKYPFYLRMVTGGCKKTAPTVVVNDGEGEAGAGIDDGHVKSGVAVTPDEQTTPLRIVTAGEAPTARTATATPEQAIDVTTTS